MARLPDKVARHAAAVGHGGGDGAPTGRRHQRGGERRREGKGKWGGQEQRGGTGGLIPRRYVAGGTAGRGGTPPARALAPWSRAGRGVLVTPGAGGLSAGLGKVGFAQGVG